MADTTLTSNEQAFRALLLEWMRACPNPPEWHWSFELHVRTVNTLGERPSSETDVQHRQEGEIMNDVVITSNSMLWKCGTCGHEFGGEFHGRCMQRGCGSGKLGFGPGVIKALPRETDTPLMAERRRSAPDHRYANDREIVDSWLSIMDLKMQIPGSDLPWLVKIFREQRAELESLKANPAETDASDAAKWRALRNCARITAAGSAGLIQPHPDNYAHVTLSFWSVHDSPGDLWPREWLDSFVAAAQRAAIKMAESRHSCPNPTECAADEVCVYRCNESAEGAKQRYRQTHAGKSTDKSK